jgi:DNA repair exonuclease SbcCD ATPase subunit
MEESTKMIMMAMADNMRVPIINPEILGNIDEIAKTYSELNRAVRDISDLTYIGDKEALKNIINIKMEGTMRAQNAYIEALERELREKEEVIRQLLEIIDEKKKKDDFVV